MRSFDVERLHCCQQRPERGPLEHQRGERERPGLAQAPGQHAAADTSPSTSACFTKRRQLQHGEMRSGVLEQHALRGPWSARGAVSGLSTGMRPVSATATTSSAPRASRRAGPSAAQPAGQPVGGQAARVGGASRDGEREDRRQQRWFDQGGNGHFAAGAHAAESGLRCPARPAPGRTGRAPAAPAMAITSPARSGPREAHQRDERGGRQRGASTSHGAARNTHEARFRHARLCLRSSFPRSA